MVLRSLHDGIDLGPDHISFCRLALDTSSDSLESCLCRKTLSNLGQWLHSALLVERRNEPVDGRNAVAVVMFAAANSVRAVWLSVDCVSYTACSLH